MSQHREGWRALKIVIMARYFLAQGLHYMNNVERAHRLLIESVLLVLLAAALWTVFGVSWWLLLAIPLAHVLMVALNGHLIAFLKHDMFWIAPYKDWDSFCAYVDRMQTRLQKDGAGSGLARAEVYGSITRGKFNEASDLDVRFIAQPGFRNAWKACGILWRERFLALFAAFPIDAYMFRSAAETAKKMKTTEEPVIVIYDSARSDVPGMKAQVEANKCR